MGKNGSEEGLTFFLTLELCIVCKEAAKQLNYHLKLPSISPHFSFSFPHITISWQINCCFYNKLHIWQLQVQVMKDLRR